MSEELVIIPVRSRISFFENRKPNPKSNETVKPQRTKSYRKVEHHQSKFEVIFADVTEKSAEIGATLNYTTNDHIRFQNQIIELLIRVIDIAPLISAEKGKLLEAIGDINRNLNQLTLRANDRSNSTPITPNSNGDETKSLDESVRDVRVNNLRSLFEKLAEQNDGLNSLTRDYHPNGGHLTRSKSFHGLPTSSLRRKIEGKQLHKTKASEKQAGNEEPEISNDDEDSVAFTDDEFDRLIQKYDLTDDSD